MYTYYICLFIYMHWEREGRLVEPKYSKTRIFEGLGVMPLMPVMPRPKLVTVQDWARDVGEAKMMKKWGTELTKNLCYYWFSS